MQHRYDGWSINQSIDEKDMINQLMRRTNWRNRWDGKTILNWVNGNTELSIDAWWIVGKDRRDRINLTSTLYAVQLHQVQKLKRLFWWDVGAGTFFWYLMLGFRTLCLQILFLKLWIFLLFVRSWILNSSWGDLILSFNEAPTPIDIEYRVVLW